MSDIPPAVLRTQMARHLADHARITVHGLEGIFVSEWELEAIEAQAATPPASAARDR